ncbi:MAG: hypothetical protein H6720_11935 [Sandaracinus sp.]|nr:hypothetical protein [Sandaracinus sp.]
MSSRILFMVLVGSGWACGGHTNPDDGSVDASATDAGPVDTGVVVAEGACPVGHACGCVGTFARCQDDCACPTGQTCDDATGLCVLATEGSLDRCNADEESGRFCRSGRLCALRDEVGFGLCVPLDTCLALRAEGGGLQCRYSDGTSVVEGPPSRVDCPASEPGSPFCGGPCGSDELCPVREILGVPAHDQCLGVSETRSFGMCLVAGADFTCRRGDLEATEYALTLCAAITGGLDPCACLVLASEEETALAVPSAACRAYAAEQDGQARCLNATWEPL